MCTSYRAELKACDQLAFNSTSMVAEETEKSRQIREEIIPKIRKQLDEYQVSVFRDGCERPCVGFTLAWYVETAWILLKNDIIAGEERLLKAKNERLDFQEQRMEMDAEVEKEEKVNTSTILNDEF